MPIDLIRLWDLSTRYTAAWCSQNPATVAAFYSHDGSLTVNDGFPAVGRNAITELAQSFMTAFPDLCVVMDNLVLQDDEAEHYRTLTGNKSVPGSAGRRVRISGVEKWRLGGKRLDRLLAGSLRYGQYRRQLDQESN